MYLAKPACTQDGGGILTKKIIRLYVKWTQYQTTRAFPSTGLGARRYRFSGNTVNHDVSFAGLGRNVPERIA